MPSTRSGASYNPSRSYQDSYKHDYGRIQSVRERQGSVNGCQTDKICHSEPALLFYLQKEPTPPQEALVDIYKASQKTYNNAFQNKE
ncbi:hypothetical protein O181_067858 [Austropuccinia psidii MF-1]|uniref:Uncharacterized protein n=1 Tax=Austropuccinia psidii MF-1 TaxID=1389203 RepID=A0A9Q3I4X7_9BASI|nr:hypothetical protein [Austropuccinia psidii MF-1]